MQIIIDPRVKFNYATFYISGIEEVFGKDVIKYDIKPFLSLPCQTWLQCNRGMPILLSDGRKIFIDYFDDDTLDEERYKWCDIYAKINLKEEHLSRSKIFAIGPSFGVNYANFTYLSFIGLRNWLKSRGETSRSFKQFLGDYIYPCIRRLDIKEYRYDPMQTEEGYAFCLATLWNGVNEKENINSIRLDFMKACIETKMNFEGGFFYIGANNSHYKQYLEEYKGFLYFKRMKPAEYLTKIRKSMLVFNCPAVAGCLGWKLGEYLSLGKAIISMPINHPMPGEGLVHGKNIHIVHNKDEIKEAIDFIRKDREYRLHLEKEAADYYENYLSPSKVVNRIFSNVR